MTSRHLAVIASDKTGDYLHIAAAAAIDDNLDILVLAPPQPPDKEKGDLVKCETNLKELMRYFGHASSCPWFKEDKSVPPRVRVFDLDSHKRVLEVESKLADNDRIGIRPTRRLRGNQQKNF